MKGPLAPEGVGIVTPYEDGICHDRRFSPAIRASVEMKCRSILRVLDENGTSTKEEEAHASASSSRATERVKREPPRRPDGRFTRAHHGCTGCSLQFELLNAADGPVAQLKRYIAENCGTDEDWSLFLGTSSESDGTLGVSLSTFDFPWFTLLLNRWIQDSKRNCLGGNHHPTRPGRNVLTYCSWHFVFPTQPNVEVECTVTVNPAVLRLPPPYLMLLERLGFTIPKPGDEDLKNLMLARVAEEQMNATGRKRQRSDEVSSHRTTPVI